MKLYDRGLYGTCNPQKDRKGMQEMPVDKKMKAGDIECLYSEKVACCKWFDRRSVTMLFLMIKECSPPAKRIRVEMYQNVQQRNW